MNLNIVSLKMEVDSTLRVNCPELVDISEAAEFFMLHGMHQRPTEHLGILCLDAKNQPTALSIAGIGGVSRCYIEPRSVFSTALLSNASSLIVAHNHPSGNTELAQSDFVVYQRLREGAKLLDLEIVDFLILSPCGKWDSFSKYERRDLPSVFRNKK